MKTIKKKTSVVIGVFLFATGLFCFSTPVIASGDNPDTTANGTSSTESAIEAQDSTAVKSILPEGRLGEVIDKIQKEVTRDGVHHQLEKAKNEMTLSQYGEGEPKYLVPSYIVTRDGNKVTVFSPVKEDGKRIDFSNGELTDRMKGHVIFWFMGK